MKKAPMTGERLLLALLVPVVAAVMLGVIGVELLPPLHAVAHLFHQR